MTGSWANLGLGARMAGRLLRRDRRLWISWITFGTSFLLCTLLMIFGQLTLTEEQEQRRALGLYDAVFQVFGDRGGDWRHLATELNSDGLEWSWSGNAPGIELDRYQGRRDIFLVDRDWGAGGHPEPVDLVDGRWPTEPGEVAVSQGLDIEIGGTLDAYAGNYQFTVVGLADHDFPEQPFLLAGPGTLADLSRALGSYRHDDEDALFSFSALHTRTSDPRELHELLMQLESLEGVDQSTLLVRSDFVSSKSWVLRLPAGFLVPGAILTVVATAVGHTLIRRRLGASMGVFASLGSNTAIQRWTIRLVETSTSTVSAVAGGLLGFSAAVLLRPIVTEYGEGYGPVRVPFAPVAVLVAASVLGAARPSIWPAGRRARDPGRASPASERSSRRSQRESSWETADLRHIGSALAASTALFVATTANAVNDIVLVQLAATVAVALMIPEAFDLVSRQVRGTQVVARLLRRRATLERSHLVSVSVGLFALLVLPLLLMTLNEVGVATALAREDTVREPGDLIIQASQGHYPPHPGVVASAADVITDAPPVRASRSVTDLVVHPGENEPLFFESLEDLEQFFVLNLSPSHEGHLRAGGVVMWDVPSGSVDVAHEDDPTRLIGSLNAQQADVPQSDSSRRFGGAALPPAATALGLDTDLHAVLYRDVADAELEGLRNEMLEAGYPGDSIEVFEEPEVVPPFAWRAAIGALFVALFATAWLFARHSANGTRSIAATLVVLGAGTRLARSVVIGAFALCLAVAVPLAVIVALVPGSIAAAQVDSFEWAIPWRGVATATAGFVALVLTATFINVSIHAKGAQDHADRFGPSLPR